MNRIDSLFTRLRSEGRRALMPFVTAGDPSLDASAELIPELVRSGAHMLEIGIPYSDPVADGPVVSASYTRALRQGVKLSAILKMLGELRQKKPDSVDVPLVTMVSYAIVFRHGVDRYLSEAAEAGVDGLIVPDLPVEESGALREQTDRRDLKLIQLITPTTPRERALEIARNTTGFIYYVSVAGITGERRELPAELKDNVAWLRSQTDLPICIGFGISRPEHIRQLAPAADGLIVGSALVRRISEIGYLSKDDVFREVSRFVRELRDAVDAS